LKGAISPYPFAEIAVSPNPLVYTVSTTKGFANNDESGDIQTAFCLSKIFNRILIVEMLIWNTFGGQPREATFPAMPAHFVRTLLLKFTRIRMYGVCARFLRTHLFKISFPLKGAISPYPFA
jgi:hypothetical protein